jgi:predicted MFS family arabinose efflux permease
MSVLNIVAFVAFATAMFTRSTDPIIPQIAGAFGVEFSTAALLATAFALPYALVQPVLGALADMFSKPRLMTICLLILVASSSVACVAPNFETLVATRMVSGIASGGIFPLALALVGDLVPVEQRQVAISRLLGASMIGTLLGASGSGLLSDLFGWQSVFVATTMVGFAVLILAVRVLRNVPDTAPGKFDLSTLGPNYRAIFGNPQAKYCFATVFFEAVFIFGIFPHMANLLYQSGEARSSIAGIVIAGFGIGAILYVTMVSRLVVWFTGRQLMLIGGLVMGFTLFVIALRLPWPVEFANFVLLGFGMYFLHGYIQVVATELAPAARGSALAIHSAAFFLGQAAGPAFYGQGFKLLGVTPTLLIGTVMLSAVGFMASRKLMRRSA